MTTATAFRLGDIQGQVDLDESVRTKASDFARREYVQAEAEEFSGESVETYVIPPWAPKIQTWWPTAALAELGFRLARGPKRSMAVQQDIIWTVGVDQHTDDASGTVLCLVLHNDGLKFKQGKVTVVPKAGEWFIFDDRIKHGVSYGKGSETFVSWNVPVEKI